MLYLVFHCMSKFLNQIYFFTNITVDKCKIQLLQLNKHQLYSKNGRHYTKTIQGVNEGLYSCKDCSSILGFKFLIVNRYIDGLHYSNGDFNIENLFRWRAPLHFFVLHLALTGQFACADVPARL